MTQALLALVPVWGPWLLGSAVFLSCLGLPVPASMLLLAAGGFVAAGDLALPTVAAAAMAGLVAGDHAMFALGRLGGAGTARRLSAAGGMLDRARDLLANRGGVVVFLSRWLMSPLGPYVNFAAGASGQPWAVFAAWGLAGEVLWIAIYLGLGHAFAGSLAAASDMALNVVLLMGAAALALGLGVWAFRR
jgi:membrane protein DedA with SNARE-associated domain